MPDTNGNGHGHAIPPLAPRTCLYCGATYYDRVSHPFEACLQNLRNEIGRRDRRQRRLWIDAERIVRRMKAMTENWLVPKRDPLGIWQGHRARLEDITYELEQLHEALDPRTPEEIAQHEQWLAQDRSDRALLKTLKRVWFVRLGPGKLYHLVDGDDEGPKWRQSLCGVLRRTDWSGVEAVLRKTVRSKPDGPLCRRCVQSDYPTRKKYL